MEGVMACVIIGPGVWGGGVQCGWWLQVMRAKLNEFRVSWSQPNKKVLISDQVRVEKHSNR
jgi:hypothetical protein